MQSKNESPRNGQGYTDPQNNQLSNPSGHYTESVSPGESTASTKNPTPELGEQGAACPQLLSLAQLALYLRKSESQLRRLVKKGALPKPIHVGETPLWSTESIRAWMCRQTEGGAQ
jgi:predicted DNA-binding transcriptional regulator AlpA